MDWEKIRDWTATVAIPLSVVLSTVIYQKGQDKLNAQAHKDEVAIKFIELGWDAILSRDDTRARQALKMLSVFDPETAKQLTIAAASDSLSYPRIGPHEQRQNLDTLARLGLLRTPVFVHSGNTSESSMSVAIAAFLTQMKGARIEAESIRTGGHPDVRPSSIHYPPDRKDVAFYLQQHIEARFRIYFDMFEEDELDGVIVHVNSWAH